MKIKKAMENTPNTTVPPFRAHDQHSSFLALDTSPCSNSISACVYISVWRGVCVYVSVWGGMCVCVCVCVCVGCVCVCMRKGRAVYAITC